MDKRTIKVMVSDELKSEIIPCYDKELTSAIGRLALWAIQGDGKNWACLYVDRDGNVGATYRDGDETGEVTYSMLGQRQADGSYSFHS
jgi:hypothetical protein